MLHFQYLPYLWGLLLVPLLVWIFLRLLQWKKLTIRKIGDPGLVSRLITQYSPGKFKLKFSLTAGALALVVLGLANLQWKTGGMVERKGLDIMVLLDVSNSMLAADLPPSRLSRAKQVVSRLLDDMPDDRIGLILFAGHAYLQMPLSSDHGAAKMYLDAAGPGSVPTQGTEFGEALRLAGQSFIYKDKKFKSVIMLTDGEDHDEAAPASASELHDQGIVVHTVGLGSPTGAFIIDPTTGEEKKDAQGNVIISKLNQPLLEDIAHRTGGTYQLYDNTDDVVHNLEGSLSAMGSQIYEDSNYAQYDSYFYLFLGLALGLLVLELFLSEKKTRQA